MYDCLFGSWFCIWLCSKKTVPTNSTSKNAESIIDEAYEILDEAWLNPNDKDVDIKGNTITALVESLGDMHSSYFTYEESKTYNQSVDGNYEGIGVAQRTVSEGTMVMQVYKIRQQKKVVYKLEILLQALTGIVLLVRVLMKFLI